MKVRRGTVRLIALAIVIVVPLMGVSVVASAKGHKHHSGSGEGGTPTPIIVVVSPNSLVETGRSEIHAVVQVETSPSFAGDQVEIDSSQLAAVCLGGLSIDNIPGNSFVLDDDGDATALVTGLDCAPGQDLVEADLSVAPYYTAFTTLMVSPPAVTPSGLTAFPVTNGMQAEVETGDTNLSGDSDIYAIFYVEESPLYAEQSVEISSAQLQDRCLTFWAWQPGNGGGTSSASGSSASGGGSTVTTLDDDGNAVFVFEGMSCAAGPSVVTADVLAGTHDTFTTTFTVLSPAPTV